MKELTSFFNQLKRAQKVSLVTGLIIFVVVLFHPGRHAKYYSCIAISNTVNEFIINEHDHNHNLCSIHFYERLVRSSVERDPRDIRLFNNFTQPIIGGEYIPERCRSLFTTAVVVPYRSRAEQLEIFLTYMHAFLQRQQIHYRIFVVEQNDMLPFNRAKLLNVGANEAMNLNFPCLVLQDVDLLPLNTGNLYACTKRPRHMSSNVDTFRYNLPYTELIGGAVAIDSSQFRVVNGMSNIFDGWGGEDDNFYKRLLKHNLTQCRLAPELSSYTMLFHKKAQASSERYTKMKHAAMVQATDGLNSLPNNYKVVLEPLYTHVIV